MKKLKIRVGVEAMLQRPLDVTQVVGQFRESFTVTQRCRACRAEIVSKAPVTAPLDEKSTIVHVGQVGGSARHAYVRHACAAVDHDAQISGMGRAELEALAAELERDGTAMIAKLAAERKS